MMSKRILHLHKYKKVNLGNNYLVFKCIKPDCSHYIRMDLVEGKLCECNRCGEPMMMNKISMQLTKPHCTECTKRKAQTKEKLDAISQFLNKPST